MKEALENNNTDEVIAEISATEFEILGGGFSVFIQQTLAEYEDYVGVSEKIKESGEFNISTLKSIRATIDERLSGKPKERANYLLSEAKLMQQLEPENTIRLRSVLSTYIRL